MKKEPLSIMIVKTLLITIIFTGMGTIIIGGGYIIGEYYKNLTSDQITEQIDQEENYYDVLKKKCNGDGCCLASLRVMRENNYKEANENSKCPEGFNGNMMRCITSYQWCEPIKEIEWESCDEDNDCEVRFSHCDCRYHCVNKNIETDDCAVECDETGPEISGCICKNDKCVEEKFLKCVEEKIILEGKLSVIHSKYPINVIETSENRYWIYETPKNFEENLNKTVRMEAIISPASGECNICYRKCPNCQCPVNQELLYSTKILEVLE